MVVADERILHTLIRNHHYRRGRIVRTIIAACLFIGGFFVTFAGYHQVSIAILGLIMMASTFGIVRWSWLDQLQPGAPRVRPSINFRYYTFGILAITLMIVGVLAVLAGVLLHYGKSDIVGIVLLCLGIALKIAQADMSPSSNNAPAKKPVLLNEDHLNWK